MEKEFITIVVIILIVIFAVIIVQRSLSTFFKMQTKTDVLPQSQIDKEKYNRIIEKSESDFKNLMDRSRRLKNLP